MRDLYDLTASEVIGDMAADLATQKGISKALAKKLILNALIYNCVQDEIMGQVDFLMGDEQED